MKKQQIPRKKKKSTAQKKKETIKKAIILLGSICVLGTIALLALQPESDTKITSSSRSDSLEQPSVNQSTPNTQAPVTDKSVPGSKKKSPKKTAQSEPKKRVTPQETTRTQEPVSPKQHKTEKPIVAQPDTSIDATTAPVAKTPVAHKGTLIFVFDDAGHNMAQLRPFLDLPFPVTIAVLPSLSCSKQAAAAILASGKELMLHQPMQAINKNTNPGPGSIQPGMTFSEITDILLDNVTQVEGLSGINNHEGSLITQDRAAMRAVLEFCRDRGLYFLDSRTTSSSVVSEQAGLLDMTIWERSVFLDNTQNTEDIIAAVKSGMSIAEKKGNAVLIGHIWSNSLAQTLRDLYPELEAQGFTMSTIARIAGYGE